LLQNYEDDDDDVDLRLSGTQKGLTAFVRSKRESTKTLPL
jgi:polyribonucleotide nucleotidyltransferase